MQAQFNSLPLLSVKPGLDSSLANISRDLESYFSSAGSDQQALKNAREELHRFGGVLRMLSLTGLAVFCAELEKLLQELVQAEDVSALRREAIRRALFGLTHYLDALADGASNATLRLFHEYQELLQARGQEMAFEVDLFFPFLQVELPEAVLQPPQEIDAPAHIKAARMQYQQALLKWLRKDGTAEALHGMMASVRSVTACVPQNMQRAYWWVAYGLLECILNEGIPPELNVRKSLSRIDLKMKSLTDGGAFDEEISISETLYLIARSHSVSDTVEQIKKIYALDTYLPEDQPMPPSETAALLENMHAELNAAQESWEQCVAEAAGACQRFAADMEKVHALSDQLDRNTLQFLSKQIHATALQADEPERAQRISMDMAMALLLLDSGIGHYKHLGSGFQEQARILSSRLQASMMRMPEDTSKLSNLISLYCQMEQQELMVPLAIEMQGNLQNIEQNLNAFFNNATKRTELSQIGRLLSQVQGGLHILSLDVAVQLMGLLRQVTECYVQGETPSGAEMRTVAAAVSTLEEYVHSLVLGHKPDNSVLNSVLKDVTEMRAASGHAETPVKEETAAPTGVSIRTGGEDEELLEVFLEEAREVMETLRNNLEVSRLHMDSREPLVTMRRGFHTLKGSGRMVGLTELGEVAWAVERAMNKWLQENKPATPALLDMIGDAEVLFQHWVDMLSSGSTSATIDTSYLLTVADCIENGKDIPQIKPERPTAEQDIEAMEKAAVESKDEGPVEVGSVSLSLALFHIATEEAAGHVQALYEQLAVLHETTSHIVTYEFMRAAHTLAGVNRTMGFVQIAELAYALELWLEERIDKPQVVNEQQMTLIDQVVQQLDEMCVMVREHRQEPTPQPELISQLQANKEIAESEAAPQELEALPELDFELTAVPVENIAEPEALPEIMLDFAFPTEATPEVPKEPQLLEMPGSRPEVEAVTPEFTPEIMQDFAFPTEAAPEVPKEPQLLEMSDSRPEMEAVTPEFTPELKQDFALPAEAAPEVFKAPQVSEMPEAFEAPISEPEAEQIAAAQGEVESEQQPTRRERGVHDEVDEQLLPIFLEEAHELYPQIGSTLRAWREQPKDAQLGRNLQRSLHTLKGSARMAGAMRLGELTHRVEDRVDKTMAGGDLGAELWSELDSYLDRIGNAIEQLHQPANCSCSDS